MTALTGLTLAITTLWAVCADAGITVPTVKGTACAILADRADPITTDQVRDGLRLRALLDETCPRGHIIRTPTEVIDDGGRVKAVILRVMHMEPKDKGLPCFDWMGGGQPAC